MQVGTWFRTRDTNLKQKTRPVTQTLKPGTIINLDLEPLGLLCNSEPLKHSKGSHSQMFFEINSLKNFAVFTGKYPVGVSF